MSLLRLCVLAILLALVAGKFVRFDIGYEYVYKATAECELKKVDNFELKAKISFTPIKKTGDNMELSLAVYSTILKRVSNGEQSPQDLNFSKWFSFVTNLHGEILDVYYAKDEDDTILAMKKAFASIIFGKLHAPNDPVQVVKHDEKTGHWNYTTRELGHEGPHTATYHAQPTHGGVQFTKTRKEHPSGKYGNHTYQKVLNYDNHLGLVSSAAVSESFEAGHQPDGFNPFENYRPVKAVNNFEEISIPSMSSIAHGHAQLLARNKIRGPPSMSKPKEGLITGNIHIDQAPGVRKVKLQHDLVELKGNLTCLFNQPQYGSISAINCMKDLVTLLKRFPDEEVVKVANAYLFPPKTANKALGRIVTWRMKSDKLHLVDAFAEVNSELTIKIITDYVFGTSPEMISRLFTHFVASDDLPKKYLVDALQRYCFHMVDFPSHVRNDKTRHVGLLLLGSYIGTLKTNGKMEEAKRLVGKLETMLGIHDPYEYRVKRAVMTEEENLAKDLLHMILLEALGNAGMDTSYEHIVSYVNVSTVPLLKRSGLHALRAYPHEQAAKLLYKAATTDLDVNVRYEAVLHYQRHPKAGGNMLMDQVGRNGTSREIQGPQVNSLYQDRQKRGFMDTVNSIFDALKIDLKSPSMDWRKMIGSKKIGASFGLIVKNELLLDIAPLSGMMKVHVHDEAYARIHLGFMGINIDYMLIRVCFAGTGSYNLNIFQELDFKKIINEILKFDDLISDVVDSIKSGVNLLNKLVNGDINLIDMFQKLVDALVSLPDKVVSIKDKALKAMKNIGKLEESELPAFIHPARKVIIRISNLFSDVKTDVMDFYNTLVDTITVIIPKAAMALYDNVGLIIESIGNFLDSPKQAISDVFKAVLSIKGAVTDLLDAKNRTMEACFFLKGQRPYWWDLKTVLLKIKDEVISAEKAISSGAPTWVASKLKSKDPILALTGGKKSMSKMKQQVVDDIKGILDDLTEPFDGLMEVIKPFLDEYNKVMDIVKRIKSAYTVLKTNYDKARTITDKVFGPRAHAKFPRVTRVKDTTCTGDGFYPSKLGAGPGVKEYTRDGVDLLVTPKEKIFAPFPGYISLTDEPNEVRIFTTGGISMANVYITNIKPNRTFKNPDNPKYVRIRVAAGQLIGNATVSPCGGANNHIHFAIRKLIPVGVIDPTRFLEQRLIQLPKWVSKCDDYKLVYKGQTKAAGSIIGLLGRMKNNKVPKRPAKPTTTMKKKASNKPLPPKQKATRADPKSSYNKAKTAKKSGKKPLQLVGFPDLEELGDKVMQKFNLKDLRMGKIVEFLKDLNMDDSTAKMVNVLKTVKELIDSKPCFNPHQATDDKLRTELMDRRLNSTGSRAQMITRITKADQRCPLLQLKMPKMLYCTFDDMCISVQCCLNMKIAMFRASFVAFARFDPCDLKFVFGFDEWKHEIPLGLDKFIGEEHNLGTGIPVPFFDDTEVRVKIKFEREDGVSKLTLTPAVCNKKNIDNCPFTFPLLDQAALPLPVCFPNGTIGKPTVSWEEFLSTDAMKKRLKESGKKLAGELIAAGIGELLAELGLPKDALAPTPACPRPQNMTAKKLDEELKKRNLTLTGTRAQKNLRLKNNDLSCTVAGKTFNLPDLSGKFEELYNTISDTCTRFDACVDFTIKALSYTKSFRAYIDLDMCQYKLTIGFERYKVEVVLFVFPWGKPQQMKISDNIVIDYTIDKDDATKEFIVDVNIKICTNSECVIDFPALTAARIPQPPCKTIFKFPGDGSIKGFIRAMGGEVSKPAFNAILKHFNLDTILPDGNCSLPTLAPGTCPWSLNLDFLPAKTKQYLSCKLADNCFGVECCVDIPFKLPLVKKPLHKNVQMHFHLDPCTFLLDVAFGPWKYQTTLLSYEWGKESKLTIGSGDPITIAYVIDKDSAKKAFFLTLTVTICLDIDGEKFCAPDNNGFKLMDSMEIPLCDANKLAKVAQQFRNASVKDWAKEQGVELGKQLAASGIDKLLEEMGIKQYLRSEGQCDPTQDPYIPAVAGWKNDCPLNMFQLPDLPDWVKCHIKDYCTGIECCASVDIYGIYKHAFQFYFDLDTCDYTLKTGFEKLSFNYTLFSYKWGKQEKINVLDMFNIKYSVDKLPSKKFRLNADLCVSFEKNEKCDMEVSVFKGTEVPQPPCDMSANFSLPSDKSVKQFMTEQGGKLDGEALLAALRSLGLGDFIGTEGLCPESGGPIKNACPYMAKKNISLPTLPSGISCAINYPCLGIECCATMDLGFLQRSFRAWAIIDPCDYKISLGFEKWQYNKTLFVYDWGSEETVKLGDHVGIIFSIDKGKKDFTINLKVKAEIPDFSSMELEILKDYVFPIPLCDPNATFVMPYNSWSDFRKDLDLAKNTGEFLFEGTMRFMGLDKLVDGNLCTIDKVKANKTNHCQHLKLPELPDWVQCTFDDLCMGITCCAELDFKVMKKQLLAWATVDPCDYQISIGFEKYSYNKSLVEDFWGVEKTLDVSDFLRIILTVNKDEDAKEISFDLTLSMLLDEVHDFNLLKGFAIPQPLCHPKFTLNGNIADLEKNIAGYVNERMLRRLGVGMDFYDLSDCPVEENPVTPKTCPYMEVPSWLPSNVRCSLTDNCLGLQCCLKMKVLKFEYTFKTLFEIMPCNFTVHAKIENWQYSKYIFEDFGATANLTVHNIFGMKVKVVADDESNIFVDFDIKMCVDGTCTPAYKLFDNSKMALPFCLDNGTYVWPKPNMKKWLSDKSRDTAGYLLGVKDKFFRKEICKVDPKKTVCPLFNLTKLPESIQCMLDPYCTGIECCLNIDMEMVSWSFRAWALLDPCEFTFSFGFENWSFNKTLLNYKWGTEKTVNVADTITVLYTIDKSKDSRNFVLSVKFEVSMKKFKLEIPMQVLLDEATIPVPICNGTALDLIGNLKWPKEDAKNLANSMVLTRLNMDPQFIFSEGCSSLVNSNSAICPYFTLPKLPEQVTCTVSDTCTGIECCTTLDLKVVKHGFKTWLNVDPCSFVLSLGFEMWTLNVTLVDYNWGQELEEKLGDAITLKYSVDKTADNRDFLIMLKVELCLDGTCTPDVTILDDYKVPIPFCNADGTYEWPSVDMVNVGGKLVKGASGLVLNRLGVDIEGLLGDECTKPTDNSDSCPSFNLPELPSNMKCKMTDLCLGIECCATVDLKMVQRNFKIWAMIEPCEFTLSVGFEREHFNITLLDYDWGTTKTLTIGDAVKIFATIGRTRDEGKFIVTVTYELCLDNTCATVEILKEEEVPVPYCHSNGTLEWPANLKTSTILLNIFGVPMDFYKAELCELGNIVTAEKGCPTVVLPPFAQKYCKPDVNCKGIECCFEYDLSVMKLSLSAFFHVLHCDNKFEFGIENKKWSIGLFAFPFDVEQEQKIGDALTLKYTIADQFTKFEVTAVLNRCWTDYITAEIRCEDTVFLNKTAFMKPGCRKRRSLDGHRPPMGRRRRAVADKLNTVPDDDIDAIVKKMTADGKSPEEIKKYFDDKAASRVKTGATVKSGNGTGYRSRMQSMAGSGPASFRSGNRETKVSGVVTGADVINEMLGEAKEVKGREDVAYIPGMGLTKAGQKVLSIQLANMTIGDIEAFLETGELDPKLVLQLMKDMKELFLAVYTDLVDAFVSGSAGEFAAMDLTLKGNFNFPKVIKKIFKFQKFFLVGGLVPMTFAFGADGFYGANITLGTKILEMKAFGLATPYVGIQVYGELGIGLLLYGKLRLEGVICELRFPTYAEIYFNKFPMDVGLKMDLVIIPLTLRLKALVTLEVDLGFLTIKKTLFSINIFEYKAPSITKNIFDVHTKDEDKSPPEFSSFASKKKKRRNEATTHCTVAQLPNRDYTEPAFEISVRAEDDKSQVELLVDAGTVPGGDDLLKDMELGGQSSIITEDMKIHGKPVYFKVKGKNSAGTGAYVTCQIPTWDKTLPIGRLKAAFHTTTNPRVMKGFLVAQDDSPLVSQRVGFGFGKEIFGDAVLSWKDFKLLKAAEISGGVVDKFTTGEEGRLVTKVTSKHEGVPRMEECGKLCLNELPAQCMSINFDYGDAGTCELLAGIENTNEKLSDSGSFFYFERLGIGHSVDFHYDDMNLLHNKLYFLNVELNNYLNYTNIISTDGVLFDKTHPETGPIENGTRDEPVNTPCEKFIPLEKKVWSKRCEGFKKDHKNERIIVDGEGSRTVFNGFRPMEDMKYSRANGFVAVNWDGFRDNETAILGYTWAVGTSECHEEVTKFFDPHAHLIGKDEWTHTGTYVREEPLPDGRYFMTLRALNEVDYGGPLATKVCHATPLVIDNTPPIFESIYNVDYDDVSYVLTANHTVYDPESLVAHTAACLGRTMKDCALTNNIWLPMASKEYMNLTQKIEDGVPAWPKLRAENHVELFVVGSTDSPIIVDTTPPEAGTVYDGDKIQVQMNFTMYEDKACASWANFRDPHSGISMYNMVVGTEPGLDDVVNKTIYGSHVYHTCIDLAENGFQKLEHGKKYYTMITAWNNGVRQYGVNGTSTGIVCDTTPPAVGKFIDGYLDNFKDLRYSSEAAVVAGQWKNFRDPESGVIDYAVKVSAAPYGSQMEVVHEFESVALDTEFKWHHFNLDHRSAVSLTLQTTNGAYNTLNETSDGYFVDLTVPALDHIGDGKVFNKDQHFQTDDTYVSANFKYHDDESGIRKYKVEMYRIYGKAKTLIHTSDDLADTKKVYTKSGLSLTNGALYYSVVNAGNIAEPELIAAHKTTGFKLDSTPPDMEFVLTGVVSGRFEELDETDTYVLQADREGVLASWLALDGESGIEEYKVCIGTKPDTCDITGFQVFKTTHGYIKTGKTKLSLYTSGKYYRVVVKALNGAGEWSKPMSGTPIKVVKEDKAGIVVDGPDGTEDPNQSQLGVNVDYTIDGHTVSTQFQGFESELHGITHVEWAIGSTPYGEDVQPFMDEGIVLRNDETALPGLVGSGKASAPADLQPGTKYYTAVRCTTNGGNTLQTASDGFMVDQMPPVVDVTSLGLDVDTADLTEGKVLYQMTNESPTMTWSYRENDSFVDNAQYSISTYPGGKDVAVLTNIGKIFPTNENSLGSGMLKLATGGLANILEVYAMDAVGLTGYSRSAAIIVDSTKPVCGKITCPKKTQELSELDCTWENFHEEESTITKLEFGLGSAMGEDNVYKFKEVSPRKSKHQAKLVNLPGYTHRYGTCKTASFKTLKTTLDGCKAECNKAKNCQSFMFKVDDCQLVNDVCKELVISTGKCHFFNKMGKGSKKAYYATIRAYNNVGKKCETYSEEIAIDSTPPVPGVIVELTHTYHINFKDPHASMSDPLKKQSCKTAEECLLIDAVCQNSMTQVSVAWTPFTDKETDIAQYFLAVGTSPGGIQIKSFFEVPVTSNHYTITKLDLMGHKQIFVTLKAYNGAGMAATAYSNGVYLTYAGQGLEPLKPLEVWDGREVYGDKDFQSELEELGARWDFSGEPCPIEKYEWAIERVDGRVIQNYTVMEEGQTDGLNDLLAMKNGEVYFSKVRATNGLGQVMIKRSDGITIENVPLIPGEVYDGDVTGFDLMYLPYTTEMYANWDLFGEKTGEAADAPKDRSQEISFYEVAVGTDRRFEHTRNNIVPFANVGLNKSVAFKELELIPKTSIYYVTVRAHSKSNSIAEVTSNGFYAGYLSKVNAGAVKTKRFWSNTTKLILSWEAFTADVEIMFYHVGVSSSVLPEMSCDHLVSVMEDDESFDVFPFQNIGKNTMYSIDGLSLEQGESYHVVITAVDGTGECNKTTHTFTVDSTKPTEGKMKVGPYWDLHLAYTTDFTSVNIKWKDYFDDISGIDKFEISLWNAPDCGKGHQDSLTIYVDWVTLLGNATGYNFVELELRENSPYYAKLRTTNGAGLQIQTVSAPVLLDATSPTIGEVVDGLEFRHDITWANDNTEVHGNFLHYATNTGDPCPSRPMNLAWQDEENVLHVGDGWNLLTLERLEVQNGTDWDIQYDVDGVILEAVDTIGIKMERATDGAYLQSGAIYRNAEIAEGGEYEIDVKAAPGEGKVVTSVVFWDGKSGTLGEHNYEEPPSWIDGLCDCCSEEPVDASCPCNCKEYLEAQAFYYDLKNVTTEKPGTTEAPTTQVPTTPSGILKGKKKRPFMFTTQRGCGFQLVADVQPYAVLWCTYQENAQDPMFSRNDLAFDPTEWHSYRIRIYYRDDDASEPQWCFEVFEATQELIVGELCGVEKFSQDTQLLFHIFNKDNFLPPLNETDIYNQWKIEAMFRHAVLPTSAKSLCRYGHIFRGGSTAIISYEAGIGTNSSQTNIADFKQVATPCVPCQKSCDVFTCSKDCDAKATTNIKFTLDGLSLAVDNNITTNYSGQLDKEEIAYYLTVKALLGSGAYVIASSNGFYIDLTPPVQDLDVGVMYIDVSQGEFEPVEYQQSNNTIKALWKCDDPENTIMEYKWAIGTTPGATDLQDYVSTGINPSGTKDGLVLENNMTYYVSIKCINMANLMLTIEDDKGIHVLLTEPDVESVGGDVVGAEPFAEEVYPPSAKSSKDSKTGGAAWTVSDDPTINRYEFCMGSSNETKEDIFPCTWVGYNSSGSVEIKNGHLYLDGVKSHPLSYYLKKAGNDTNFTSIAEKPSNFNMEPGRTVFTHLKICNKANKCMFKFVASTLVIAEGDEVKTSKDGSPIEAALTMKPVDKGRKKRGLGDDAISIVSPPGLQPGQALVVGLLKPEDVAKDFGSDAATDFQSYIVDPQTTSDMAERTLQGRIVYMPPTSFFITSVGHLPMPDRMEISYTFDASRITSDSWPMLLHWDPSMLSWVRSATTCNPSKYTFEGNTLKTEICRTRGNPVPSGEAPKVPSGPQRRRREAGVQEYFAEETQFILADISNKSMNTAPEIAEQDKQVDLEEDSGTLTYQLSASDIDGDTFVFSLDTIKTSITGDVSISEDGLLTYTPCADCVGIDTIHYKVTETNMGDLIPLVSESTFVVNVVEAEDVPVPFVARWRRTLYSGTFISREMHVSVEQELGYNLPYKYLTLLVGAFDQDTDENLSILMPEPAHGNITFGTISTDVPVFKTDCSGEPQATDLPCPGLDLPHAASNLSWIITTLTYKPDLNYQGEDSFRFIVQDKAGRYSNTLTVHILVSKNIINELCTPGDEGDDFCESGVRNARCDPFRRTCQCNVGMAYVPATGMCEKELYIHEDCQMCRETLGHCYDLENDGTPTGCACLFFRSSTNIDVPATLESGCNKGWAEIGEICDKDGKVVCMIDNSRCVHGGDVTGRHRCRCKPGYQPVKEKGANFFECYRSISELTDVDCTTCRENSGTCYDKDGDKKRDGCHCPPSRTTSDKSDITKDCDVLHVNVSCKADKMKVCYVPHNSTEYPEMAERLYDGDSRVYIKKHYAKDPCILQKESDSDRWCVELSLHESKTDACGTVITHPRPNIVTYQNWLVLQMRALSKSGDDLTVHMYCQYDQTVHAFTSTGTNVVGYKAISSDGDKISPELEMMVFDEFRRDATTQGLRLGQPAMLEIQMTDDKSVYNSIRPEICIATDRPELTHPDTKAVLLLTKGCPAEDSYLNLANTFRHDAADNEISRTGLFPVFKFDTSPYVFFHCGVRTCRNLKNCAKMNCTNSRVRRALADKDLVEREGIVKVVKRALDDSEDLETISTHGVKIYGSEEGVDGLTNQGIVAGSQMYTIIGVAVVLLTVIIIVSAVVAVKCRKSQGKRKHYCKAPRHDINLYRI